MSVETSGSVWYWRIPASGPAAAASEGGVDLVRA